MVRNSLGNGPSYFADAEATFNQGDIVIFGVPFDKTSCFRPGARFGPEAIRKASWNFESYNIMTDVNIKDYLIHDYGDVLIHQTDNALKVFQTVNEFTKHICDAGKIPIMLGGEHTFSAASIHSFSKEVIAIIFDAHLDFRETYVDESINHACTIRRINEFISGDHLYVLGIRSADNLEYEEAKKNHLNMYTSETIQLQGIERICSMIKKKIKNKPVYLSIDIDVLDPCYAPGTGTLEPFGLIPLDILGCIDTFSSSLVGLDLMEVAPQYDSGQTAVLAAKLIRHALDRICEEKILPKNEK